MIKAADRLANFMCCSKFYYCGVLYLFNNLFVLVDRFSWKVFRDFNQPVQQNFRVVTILSRLYPYYWIVVTIIGLAAHSQQHYQKLHRFSGPRQLHYSFVSTRVSRGHEFRYWYWNFVLLFLINLRPAVMEICTSPKDFFTQFTLIN